MDQETTDKKIVSFTVKVVCSEGTEKKLPSPARFLELQGIDNPSDIEVITRYTLLGNRPGIIKLLVEGYSKSEEEGVFIAQTYSDAIFQFVLLAVNYNHS